MRAPAPSAPPRHLLTWLLPPACQACFILFGGVAGGIFFHEFEDVGKEGRPPPASLGGGNWVLYVCGFGLVLFGLYLVAPKDFGDDDEAPQKATGGAITSTASSASSGAYPAVSTEGAGELSVTDIDDAAVAKPAEGGVFPFGANVPTYCQDLTKADMGTHASSPTNECRSDAGTTSATTGDTSAAATDANP